MLYSVGIQVIAAYYDQICSCFYTAAVKQIPGLFDIYQLLPEFMSQKGNVPFFMSSCKGG